MSTRSIAIRDLAIGTAGSIIATGILAGLSLLSLPWAIAVGLSLLTAVEASLLWRYYTASNLLHLKTIGLLQVKSRATPPEEVLSSAVRSIEFWGISGKRTASNPRVQQAIVRVAGNGDRVRFLLLDPSSRFLQLRAQHERESSEAWVSDINSTRTRLAQLAHRETIDIEVRFFDAYPVWRMFIVDRQQVRVNWFLSGKQGPESPELTLQTVDDGLLWPLARSYDECWEGARDA